MRKLIVFLMVAAFILPVSLQAGIHGILKGKVVDSDGKGLIGATVQVQGTSRGTVVQDPEGKYTVVNIVAGEYEVKFSYIGYKTVIKSVVIEADKTVEVNATLREEGVMTEEVEVVASKIMVNKSDIGQSVSHGTESLTQTVGADVNSVVSLSAGVQSSGSGFRIRGSRSSSTQIRVDGMTVSNQFTGGYGAGGNAYFPMVSSYALSEVQVMTGGFSAEYGNAMGGVVNSVVKTGSQDGYEGYLRYGTDLPSLNGSQESGLEVIREGNDLVPIETGEGLKWLGENRHNFDISLGGPLPLIDKSTFYFNAVNNTKQYRGNSYDKVDPMGTNWGQLDHNRSWVKNITGRLNFQISNDIRLLVGGDVGISNWESVNGIWVHLDNEGFINGENNGVPEYQAKLPVVNQLKSTVFAKINHTLSDKMFYEFQVSRTVQNEAGSKRNDPSQKDPDFFTGFDVLKPNDSNGDNIVDQFEYDFQGTMTNDGYNLATLGVRNPFTGYIEGGANYTGTSNPWGLANYFPIGGNTTGVTYRDQYIWKIDGDLTSLVETGEFEHTIKTGFEVNLYELHKFQINNPWSGNPFYDIYTDQYGGNFLAFEEDYPGLYDKTSQPFKPYQFSIYGQDQISYKGIILSGGLRLDYFNPNSQYRDNRGATFLQISADSGFSDASGKLQISPRINVSYPITDKAILSINYGTYFEMPLMQYMYDGFNTQVLRAGALLGQPNMDAQRTNAYQVDYKQQITDDLSISISTYYKDKYNEVGVLRYRAVPEPFFQYTNADYGNAKGIEFSIRKLPTNHVSFEVNYTYSSVTGTSQSPAQNYNVVIDPYTDLPAFPLAPYPMGWDIRHQLKGTVTFIWRDDEGPSIGGIKPLENAYISFDGSYRSGTPYTKRDAGGTQLSAINAERNPSAWNLSTRLSKSFMLRDIMESLGNTRVQVFLDIANVLNRTAARSVYPVTGDPIDNGTSLETQIGNFAKRNYYKEPDYSFPESINPSTQYDDFGNRLYSEYADHDGNGVVTQSEQYESYINYIEYAMKSKGNFQIPRRVSLGVMINF